MAQFVASKPSMQEIGESQDEERNLRRLLAKAHYYAVANLWHFTGAALAIAFALASPFVLVYWPKQGPLLGAIAGTWIFITRILFEPVKQRYQLKGATVQELFDCEVLGLTWNEALVRQPSNEEIRSASKNFVEPKKVNKQRQWYPTQEEIAWPQSVIICQRANSVWSQRQQKGYGIALIVLAAAWVLFGIIFSIFHHASLAMYLTTIALPSLPAVLDAVDLSKKHLRASSLLQGIEDAANSLLDKSDVSYEELREIQDQIFDSRRDAPQVPSWFYTFVRPRYEEDMRYAAKESADQERD